MSSVMLNILIGLITTVISGGSVWLAQRAKAARLWRGKAAFFGIQPGQRCLLILSRHHEKPRATGHRDVRALLEVAPLVEELGGRISVEPADEFLGTNGEATEFCLGGPVANRRSAAHLAHHLPGVAFTPLGPGPDSGAITAGGEEFRLALGEREYAVIAKFTPREASRPVFLICGQVQYANLAAMHFLKRDHRSLSRSLASPERFCLVVRISASRVYGHERVELERDVTAAAFRGA
ncbi:hypothetical protein [Streptomyces sp. SBT349]|uniref:hypothetical protein n=1 Tax=Streptomyces sp. SBT349 TaxID=1580539 RepID=UPI00066B9A7F|nr:hypothetical protein [Streptomyces sp. SBT349]